MEEQADRSRADTVSFCGDDEHGAVTSRTTTAIRRIVFLSAGPPRSIPVCRRASKLDACLDAQMEAHTRSLIRCSAFRQLRRCSPGSAFDGRIHYSDTEIVQVPSASVSTQ